MRARIHTHTALSHGFSCCELLSQLDFVCVSFSFYTCFSNTRDINSCSFLLDSYANTSNQMCWNYWIVRRLDVVILVVSIYRYVV